MPARIDRIGETAVATNGQKMTIIAYRGNNDMDVRFEDGYVAYNKRYDAFREGKIGNPNKTKQKSRIGETAVATNGQVMTIIAYRGSGDIDVRFEDGYVACNKRYNAFKEGAIKNPNKSAQLKADIRIGETRTASNGQVITIIAYRGSEDIDVRFEDGYVACNKSYQSFKKGRIGNPNKPSRLMADSRIGETTVATNGQVMTIIAYRGSGDIDVRFEDGYVAYNKHYNSFKAGTIKNPNKPSTQLKTDIRIGETQTASNGQKMTIIAYRNRNDIDVQFEDGYVAYNKGYDAFKCGKIKNPNTPNVRLKTDSRVGETSIATNGQKMTIIAYRSAQDIDAQFEDGYVACNKSYYALKEGKIRNLNKNKQISHIGETTVATNGQRMTIIAYRGTRDIDVQFEDGYVACNKSYGNFKKGTIKNPKKSARIKPDSRIGETTFATNGQVMTIIAYRGNNDIDVRFEDGYIAYNKSYGCFKKGEIKNPNKSALLKTDIRIGETSFATNGQVMTIIAYRSAYDMDVQFEDGYVAYNKSYDCFKTGRIENPRFPMRGKGTYKTFETQYAYTTPDGSIYFYCECQKCGWKKNLTAHEIINLNHACEDTEGSETQCPQEKTGQEKPLLPKTGRE